VKPLDQWPFWKRAVLINASAAAGVYIGFASSGVNLPLSVKVYTAVFAIVFINAMLFVVRPRIIAQKAAGIPAPNPWRVVYEVLAERPFITGLLIIQFLGMSRTIATSIEFMQASASDYVRGLPNAQSMTLRLMGMSVLMAGVSMLWLLGAIGLWRSRRWAWWLVLALNGLSATVSVVVQVLKLDEFLLDLPSMAAVVVLLLPAVRMEFRGGKTAVKQTLIGPTPD